MNLNQPGVSIKVSNPELEYEIAYNGQFICFKGRTSEPMTVQHSVIFAYTD
jgi:hypothetical protein